MRIDQKRWQDMLILLLLEQGQEEDAPVACADDL